MAAKKTSRRQFLTGEAAIDAIGDIQIGGDDLPVPGGSRRRSLLLEFERRAMACKFQVYVNSGQYQHGPDAAVHGLDLIDELEGQLTVYRDDSEIAVINQTAAAQEVDVEARLFGLLQRATELHRITGGAFDITAGPLTRLWGFHRREGNFPTQDQIDEVLKTVGSQWIELDETKRSIRFQVPGIELNLGGIGKGYALDRCASLMDFDEEVEHFLLHGGHSSVLGRGDKGYAKKRKPGNEKAAGNGNPGDGESSSRNEDAIGSNAASEADDSAITASKENNTSASGTDGVSDRSGWSVALRHPLRTDHRLAEIWLFDEALGTSGAANQYFYHRGKRYGHVLDPRTGWPAEGTLSATVVTERAETADALATACYVMGLDEVQRFHSQFPEHGIIMVTPGKRAGQNEVHTFGMEDRKWRLLMDKI